MLRGIDVASVNNLTTVLTALHSTQFAGVKATEGATWNDPAHAQIVAACRRLGVKVIHYHFAWPEHSAVVEAQHFLAFAQPQPGDLVALDLERWSAVSWSQRVAYAIVWLDYVKAHTGASPVIYLNYSWIVGLKGAATAAQWAHLTSFPLWFADPTGVPGRFDHPSDWPVWTIHQYGIVGGLDADVLNGDFTVWSHLAVPQPPARTVTVPVVVGAVAGAVAGAVIGHTVAPAPAPVKVPTPTVTVTVTHDID